MELNLSEIFNKLSIGKVSPEEIIKPYLPFIPAIEQGILDLSSIVAQKLTDPVGVLVGNGMVPNTKNGGVVESSRGIRAVDHLSLIEAGPNRLILGPSCKTNVEGESGKVQGEGIFALTDPDGFFRVIGVAIDAIKNPWQAINLDAYRTTGRIAVASFGLGAANYQISEIDNDSGIMTATPRQKYQ